MTSDPQLPEVGALEGWRSEVQAGKRRNTGQDFDALAAAACWEACALEMQTAGDVRTARDYLDMATLRLHDHWLPLNQLHDEAAQTLLRSIRGEARRAARQHRATWLERSAALAREYAE
jgi:hypothetical protein